MSCSTPSLTLTRQLITWLRLRATRYGLRPWAASAAPVAGRSDGMSTRIAIPPSRNTNASAAMKNALMLLPSMSMLSVVRVTVPGSSFSVNRDSTPAKPSMPERKKSVNTALPSLPAYASGGSSSSCGKYSFSTRRRNVQQSWAACKSSARSATIGWWNDGSFGSSVGSVILVFTAAGSSLPLRFPPNP